MTDQLLREKKDETLEVVSILRDAIHDADSTIDVLEMRFMAISLGLTHNNMRHSMGQRCTTRDMDGIDQYVTIFVEDMKQLLTNDPEFAREHFPRIRFMVLSLDMQYRNFVQEQR